MPATVQLTHSREPSFVSLLSSWAQQGVQSFFTTHRSSWIWPCGRMQASCTLSGNNCPILKHSPTAILGEVAAEGVTNFIEGQKVLLELGLRQHEILMEGVKERIGEQRAAHALTDLLRRSVETFVHMQQEFLKIAWKANGYLGGSSQGREAVSA